MHAFIPLTFSLLPLSLCGAGNEGWDQMRDEERMEKEEEERGGDERRLRGEEEQQQVVIGGVPLTPSPVWLLLTPVVQKVPLPSSGVPSGLSHTLPPHPHPLSLSPSHMEARPAKGCVNVTRSARPPSSLPLPSLLLFFPLVPTSSCLWTQLDCNSNGIHVRQCVFVYLKTGNLRASKEVDEFVGRVGCWWRGGWWWEDKERKYYGNLIEEQKADVNAK